MANELSKQDLEQLEADLKQLKEAYQKELEREATERDLQATKDSEQSKILAEKAVKDAEAEKLQIEADKKEREASENFRSSVLDALVKLDTNEKNELTNESLATLNENIALLVAYEKRNDTANVNGQFLNSALVIGLALFLSIYVLFKTLSPLVQKLSGALFKI